MNRLRCSITSFTLEDATHAHPPTTHTETHTHTHTHEVRFAYACACVTHAFACQQSRDVPAIFKDKKTIAELPTQCIPTSVGSNCTWLRDTQKVQ